MHDLSQMTCRFCKSSLFVNPLFDKNVSMYCPGHGDYFVYNNEVVFRPFERKTKVRDQYLCEQTGKVYSSQLAAAKSCGATQHDVFRHLHGLARHVRGYTFLRLVDDGMGNRLKVPRPIVPSSVVRKPLIIRCNETREVFVGVLEASKALGVHRANLLAHLHGDPNRKTVNGYTFTELIF